MKVAIFGATGMVGQGVIRECLRNPEVEHIVSVVRTPSGVQHAKLCEVIHENFLNYSTIENQLTGLTACLFCLGVTSARMNEEAYSRVTYEFTMAAAKTLLRLNPGMSFVYVSGAGTDSTEHGRVMWARVKGKTENALLAMPFRAAYMFRPGAIQPLHGIASKNAAYRVLYKITFPLLTAARCFWPQYITTTQELGRAMLVAACHGTEKRVVEAKQIREILQGQRAGKLSGF